MSAHNPVVIKYHSKLDGVEFKTQSDGAAAIDLPILSDPTIGSGEVHVVPTGISIEIPEGYVGKVSLRSSMGKRGLVIPNAPGLIDSDYRGEIKIILSNLTKSPIELVYGHRIAQLTVEEVQKVEAQRVSDISELSKTSRGDKGFGSTGK